MGKKCTSAQRDDTVSEISRTKKNKNRISTVLDTDGTNR